MSQTVTLELPESLFSAAEQRARQDRRSLEAVLLEWLDQGADLPVEKLGDEQVLELTRSQMSEDAQSRLSLLLAKQREAALQGAEADALATLMSAYRRGLVRKAQALSVAAKRGLVPPLS